MNIKRHIRLLILMCILIGVGFILSTSVFIYFPISGIVPNILLIITSAYGYFKGENYGMICGVICGFLVDIYSNSLFGLYILFFLIIGFTNGQLAKVLFGDGIRLPVLLVAFSDFLYGIFCFLQGLIRYDNYNFYDFLLNIIFPEMVYTALVAFVLIPVIISLNKLIDPTKEARRL